METGLAGLTLQLWHKFGLALLVGLLMGLEREHRRQEREAAHFAGIRTFPLIALLGCTAAMLSAQGQTWLFAVGFAGLSALILAVYTVSTYRGDPGMTTEVAALLIYLIGGLIYWDQIWLAVTLGVAATALMALRPTLHELAARIEREDIYATLKFAVVSAVILPLLPDRAYGPLQVLNPFRMWLMVVFISAVSFAGYVAIKLLGPRRGIGLT
nr:MgtC/SapB family protein [Anaerolineae bacterium]